MLSIFIHYQRDKINNKFVFIQSISNLLLNRSSKKYRAQDLVTSIKLNNVLSLSLRLREVPFRVWTRSLI